MKYGKMNFGKMDRENGWEEREKRLSATQNLRELLDHGDKTGIINLTAEKSWLSNA